MSDEPSLEKRAATARRDYWHRQYTAALESGDKEAAASALRFVQEYDALLAIIACRPGEI